FYHWGQPEQALEQFNLACGLYLQYPRWMLRAQFDRPPVADTALARTIVPWGASQRRFTPGTFPTAINVAQGTLDNSQALRQGGPLQSPELWPINVIEIVRCTALAIRRRNEILGPLGAHDAISKNLSVNLARGGAPPNHWSGAFVDIQRGLALIGIGDTEQGLQLLERGTLVAGQFDHPLTCVALLEQGRLALDAGNTAAAGSLLAEASYSAFLYEDVGVIDDAFRYGELNRVAMNAGDLNPALAVAAEWARRERLELLAARLNLALADELMTLRQVRPAAAAIAAGVSQLNDARTGVLGNWAQFLEARLQFLQARSSAPAALETAVEGQRKISLPNFQISLANNMFDRQTLPTRSAPLVYEALLADAAPMDAAMRPLETLAVMTTPHPEAFERWLLAALERKNIGAAVEITERAKRRRLHNSLPWGGRLAALRDLLATPTALLSPAQRQLQSEVLDRFPAFAKATEETHRLRSELDARWRPPLKADAQRRSAQLWDQYAAAIASREQLLQQIGVSRAPAELAFPPLSSAADLQQQLAPGQALLVFHDTTQGMLGVLITAKAATHWNCGPSNRIAGLASEFLRDLGNRDASGEISTDELVATDWQKSGAKLFEALFAGSSLAPSAVSELVVVPDGITWYVPFEALWVDVEGEGTPLVKLARVRYAPTAALAFSFKGPWRRVQRTGIVAGDALPGDDDPQVRLELTEPLQAAVPGAVALQPPLPAPSPAVATLLDSLIVLDDVETQGEHPLAWSPLPMDRNEPQGALTEWQALPDTGPQRILLPAMHTLAERGGRATSRRRGGYAVAPGDDLFFASCGLMSAGAETLLLSRWRVGGQSMLDLVREFAQELPHTAAADAWQRSVQLAMEMPIDPLSELRVRAGKDAVDLTAAHPFFWAGYMVVDSGWRPQDVEAEAEAVPEDAAAAPPEVPSVPPKPEQAAAAVPPQGAPADVAPPPGEGEAPAEPPTNK
ncbi:MAG TPA: CHAT domain-containing protein, partial [Lacipirellula sp.]